MIKYYAEEMQRYMQYKISSNELLIINYDVSCDNNKVLEKAA